MIIGSGGREHALARAFAQSPQRPELFFAPGNPGMESLGQRLEIDVLDIQGLRIFAQREGIDLTVVGPEAPLVAGLTDDFEKHGLLVFGPNQACARLEGSKAFAKKLMQTHGIPTAAYYYCTDRDSAMAALDQFEAPYVVKEDGLAAGKGVTVAPDRTTADAAVDAAMAKQMPVVIESFLKGEELSVLAICDGQRAIPLVSAQDFKRLGDGDAGPNTGGMGAYAPVPLATEAVMQRVQQAVLDPMMRALQAEGLEYRGVLYAGLMIEDGNPAVVEFNVRFGDPETQVVLPLIADDLVAVLQAAAEGDLSRYPHIRIQPGCAVTVVLASPKYPASSTSGLPMTLPADAAEKNGWVIHAGTRKLPDGTIVTNGGRVLNAVGTGATLREARDAAYRLVDAVQFEGKQNRSDIALKAAKAGQPLSV
ncbi:MAG: phosphoribosylamine--glycine ligase [Candidatus Melainabacteria bacterium]